MRKSLSCVALLLLLLGANAPLDAAECQAVAAPSPALTAQSTPAEVQEPAQPDLAEVVAELGALSAAEEKLPPPPFCTYTACYLTPTGCGCEGFYCNGRFICGYPRW